MGNRGDKDKVNGVNSLNPRPTVGLLAEVGGSPYHRVLWEGFIDAALEKGARAIVAGVSDAVAETIVDWALTGLVLRLLAISRLACVQL